MSGWHLQVKQQINLFDKDKKTATPAELVIAPRIQQYISIEAKSLTSLAAHQFEGHNSFSKHLVYSITMGDQEALEQKRSAKERVDYSVSDIATT